MDPGITRTRDDDARVLHTALERVMRMRAAYLLLAAAGVLAAQSNPAARAAREWRETHERAIVAEFIDLLAIPNLARDAADIRKNAAAVSAILERRGVRTRLLETPGAPPAVYGEIRTAGAARSIVFYAHYDGQPLDPKEWASPPWQPTLRDRPLEKDGRVIALPASGKLPGMAAIRALGGGRQDADHRHRGGARRARGRGYSASLQREIPDRRRGGGGLPAPGPDHRPE
jgi:hypothetical protein